MISNIELPTLAPVATRVGSPNQIGRDTRSFDHTLLEFLNRPSKTGTSRKEAPNAAVQRGSTLKDAKPLPEVYARVAQQALILPQQTVVPHQDLSAQQGQLSFPDIIPVLQTIKSTLASPDSLTIVDQPIEFGHSVSPVLSEVDRRVDVLTDPQSTSSNFALRTVPNYASDGFAIPGPIAATGASPDGVQSSLSRSADQNSNMASSPFITPSPFLNAHSDANPVEVHNTDVKRQPNDAPSLIKEARLSAVSASIHSFSLDELPATIVNVRADAAPNTILGGLSRDLPITGQNLITPDALNSIPGYRLGTNPTPDKGAPVMYADGGVASEAKLAGQGIPTQPPPEQSSLTASHRGLSVGSDLQVAATQLVGEALKGEKVGISSLLPTSLIKPSVNSVANGKDAPKGANNDQDLKQHPQQVSAKSDSHPNYQEITQTSDQSRGYPLSQGQNTALDQASVTGHGVVAVAHTQPIIIIPPVPSTASIVASSDQKAMAAGNAVYASTAPPQSLPVINTAKLIQSIGQAEMRVGMRSSEFGNISINTSATRGLISAQISLDHSELARILTAHLPEMQARLGGNEAVDVRINTNGIGEGQGVGMAGGMSNGSSDHSRDSRQQPGSAGSNYFGSGFVARQSSPVDTTLLTSDGRLSARLDVRF